MNDHKVQVGILWTAVISLVLVLAGAVVEASAAAGRLDTRVTALEQNSTQTISRGEWGVFAQDMRDRLDRIENKIDAAQTPGSASVGRGGK